MSDPGQESPASDVSDNRRRPLPVHLQTEHPQWVRDLAFVCWLQADRNAARALHLLEEHWPEDEPCRPVPYRTLAAWAQRGNWDARADQVVAENFGAIVMRHSARLVHLAGLALTTLEAVISSDGFVRDTAGQLLLDDQGAALVLDPRHQRNRLEGAVKALELAGVGTAGSRNRVAPVVRPVVTETHNLAGMSEEELAALQLKLLHESKTHPAVRERNR